MWSDRLENRRLRFYGHVLRLSEETPIRKALAEFTKKHKRLRGKSNSHDLKLITNDLKKRGIAHIKQAENLAKDRKAWQKVVVTEG